MSEHDHGDYVPDFILSHYDVIDANNWSGYKARGFEHFLPAGADSDEISEIGLIQRAFGVANVYTGRIFDDELDWPSRTEPGTSIYLDAEAAMRHAIALRKDAPPMPPIPVPTRWFTGTQRTELLRRGIYRDDAMAMVYAGLWLEALPPLPPSPSSKTERARTSAQHLLRTITRRNPKSE